MTAPGTCSHSSTTSSTVCPSYCLVSSRFRFLPVSLSPSFCLFLPSRREDSLSFMTTDMWQFPFVNDKKCANYLSGCSTANQTLTSCERVAELYHVRVCVGVGSERKLDKCASSCRLLLHFNHFKSFHKCSVEIGLPFHLWFY